MTSEEEIKHEKEWLQHHYDMWNEIVEALKKDSKADISPIKQEYTSKHNPDDVICCNCYLCDMYSCSECPLGMQYHHPCCQDNDSIFSIAADVDTPYSRIDAAEAIRDCVINWRC